MLDFGFYNMDCMDGMRQFPNNFFDLAIVDPPYGINAGNMNMGSNPNRKGRGQYPGISTAERLKKGRLNQGSGKLKGRAIQKMNCDWDFEPPTSEYWEELFRISRNQIIWGGNYFPLPPTRGIVVWDKCQPWENFSQIEMAWTSFDRPAAIFRYSNTGGANREMKDDYIGKHDVIYVGETIVFQPWVLGPDVIEHLEEQAFDEYGEVAEGWDVWNELRQKGNEQKDAAWNELSQQLTDVVNDWIAKYDLTPNFYKIVNVREVKL